MLLLLRLKTVLRQLLLPPSGPLLLALIGLLLLNRRPRLARGLLAVGLGSLWLLSMPVIADAIARLAEHYPPLDLAQIDGAQAIVILGGGGQRDLAPEYGGPAAEAEQLERLAYGAFVARRTGLPILVTGFGGEAVAMRATLRRNFDVDPRWVDDQAYDTFQNARNAARLLKPEGVHRVILVTRATHMWRSVHEVTAAGLEVVPAPFGILAPRIRGVLSYIPDVSALGRSYQACYELLGEPVRIMLAATHLRRQ
jgi:uncharacterized SAM-binding protein YcdF (DUF218 family)